MMLKKGENIVKEFISGTTTNNAENEASVENIPYTPDQSYVVDEFYCIDFYFFDVQSLQTIYS